MSDTITITGNIATPPERKATAGGVPITSFRIASSQRRYDRENGRWVDGETNWYRVSAYRGLADHVFDSFLVGERVIVTGRLRLREWDTGTKKGLTAEIDADAAGHDLLWGTTRFRKIEGQSQSAADPARSEAERANGDHVRVEPPWKAPGETVTTEWDAVDTAGGELAPAQTPF